MVHAHLVMLIAKGVSAKMSASTVNKALFSSVHPACFRTAHSHAPLVKDHPISVLLVLPARSTNTIFMRTNV